jgi:hypothetical protein
MHFYPEPVVFSFLYGKLRSEDFNLELYRYLYFSILETVFRVRIRLVFGPPGSGSTSQRYGSGSFYHQAKIVRKTLIPTVL